MENKNSILVCAECGSKDVEAQAWVKVNENDSCNGYIDLESKFNNYCCSCEEHTKLIPLKKWEDKSKN